MSTSTLAPRRRSTGPAPPQPAPRRAARRSAPPRHHSSEPKVWRWAIVVSVLLHVLVLALSPVFIRVGLPPGDPDAASDGSAGGLRMVDPALLPDAPQVAATTPVETPVIDDAARISPTRDRPPAREVPPRPGAPGRPDAAPRTGEGAADARDNPLRPGLRDPRLWIAPREVPKHEPSQEELHAEYMAGLEARLGTWNDSIAGEADRARRAADWTVRDKSGRRWGVSPDGIHLGDVTLPPTTFIPGGGDPDKRARGEQEERTRGEIDRQQADTDRRRAQEESIRATRERRDEERNRQRSNQR
jgi:hypothetical protein